MKVRGFRLFASMLIEHVEVVSVVLAVDNLFNQFALSRVSFQQVSSQDYLVPAT